MNWAALDWSILGPALAAGLLVLATHVPLGKHVLDRGIVFIDLAIAQIAGLGVIVAHACRRAGTPHGWRAGQRRRSRRCWAPLLPDLDRAPRRAALQEALIGVAVRARGVRAASWCSANNPHGGEHLKDLLVGQILWVDTDATGLACRGDCRAAGDDPKRCHANAGSLWFYGVFAIAVTASVQLVGVYLVFSSLIVPALATTGVMRGRLPHAYAIGAVGYALGLGLSALFDLPTGAIVVCALALTGAAYSIAARRCAA